MRNSTKIKKSNKRRWNWASNEPRKKASKVNGCTTLIDLRAIWRKQQSVIASKLIRENGCGPIEMLKEISAEVRGRAGKVANQLIKMDYEADVATRAKRIQQRAHDHVERNAKLGMYDLFPHE